MPRAPRPFRKEGRYRNLFFTWNNPTLEHDEWIRQVEPYVQYGVFQLEEGEQEGTPHYQGVFELKTQMRGSAILDKLGAIHWEDRIDPTNSYVMKEETRVDGPWEFGTRKRPGTRTDKASADEVAAEALRASSVDEGLAIIKEGKPMVYLLHGESIKRNLEEHHKKPFVVEIEHTLEDYDHEPLTFEKNVFVYGESGLGKTGFVLAHFENPLLISHIDDVKKHYTPAHDAIVFDDMQFLKWPPESVIHLVDRQYTRSIHIRYGTVTFPAGVIKVFTSNRTNPFYDPYNTEPAQQQAIWNRLTKVHIDHDIRIINEDSL